jgi:hypothetical protein
MAGSAGTSLLTCMSLMIGAAVARADWPGLGKDSNFRRLATSEVLDERYQVRQPLADAVSRGYLPVKNKLLIPDLVAAR